MKKEGITRINYWLNRLNYVRLIKSYLSPTYDIVYYKSNLMGNDMSGLYYLQSHQFVLSWVVAKMNVY